MTPRNRNRIGLILILLLFAAPLLTAYVLNTLGWRPAGTRNYGILIEPPQDLTAARFVEDDGKPIAWKDEDWSWTVFALPGPSCAKACLERIDELRRARLTLNQNAFRVRVVVLGDVDVAAIAAMKPVTKLMSSHGKRLLTTKSGRESARSSLPAPTICCRSSVAACWAARTSASYGKMPRI
jgi:hypothetical protein